MQGMEFENPEDFLRKTREIFAEREKEFQLRQQAFEEKENRLKSLLQRITSEKEELNERRKEIEKKHTELEEEKKVLCERSSAVKEQEAEVQKQRERIEEQEKSLMMKYNLELEQVRNDEMRLKRLTADYEYKLSMMDPEMASVLQNPGPVADLTEYVSVEEHHQKIALAEEEIQELREERNKLTDMILDMKEERGKLLAKILELRSIQNEKTKRQEEVQKETDREKKEVDATEDTEPERETEEELTASVLKSYLTKNRSDFERVEIRHSEDGELLYGEGRGLVYHFLFMEPSTFDISAERKNSSRLRKQLEMYNEKFPGVQFRYDESEKKVYATGYFTNQLKAYELMKRVQEIADCFRQE